MEHRLFELIPLSPDGSSLLSPQAIKEAKEEIEKLNVDIDLLLEDDLETNILSFVQLYPSSDERDDFISWLIQNGSSPFLINALDTACMHRALFEPHDSILILKKMLELESMSIISILQQVATCIAKATEQTLQFFKNTKDINSIEKLKETMFDKFLDACLELKLEEPQKKDLIDYLESNLEIRNIENTENIAFAEFSLTQEKIDSFEQKLLKVTSPLSLFKTATNYLIKEGLNEDKVNRLEKEGNLPKHVVEILKIRLKR